MRDYTACNHFISLPGINICCQPTHTNPSVQAFSGTAFAFLSAWFFHLGAPGFAFGSCFGFCLGTLYYWKHTMSESVAAYRHFPTLMLLHLRRNFPTFGFENYRVEAGGERGRRELERFDRRFEREWSVRCLMMSAYQTAGPAIEVSCCDLVVKWAMNAVNREDS